MNPMDTVDAAIERLHLRSEVAYDASLRVNRPDFAEQGENFFTLAGLLIAWRTRR